LEKNSPSKQNSLEANALLCPVCCVEYVEIEIDFEVDGVILHNVKALKCPACEEELFTPQQIETIKKQIINPSEP
jgi:YgiT-type zinc finger domain-containing protein